MTTHRIKYTESWATISPCQRYRYELGRRWGDGAMLTWVMLNPSTADAGEDDPTIRRCAQFSQDYGFHGLVVRNLFAYRATNPKELARVEDSVGSDNDVPLLDKIVFAWGANTLAQQQAHNMVTLYPDALCLGVTKNGDPRHPLYVPRTRGFVRYDLARAALAELKRWRNDPK